MHLRPIKMSQFSTNSAETSRNYDSCKGLGYGFKEENHSEMMSEVLSCAPSKHGLMQSH